MGIMKRQAITSAAKILDLLLLVVSFALATVPHLRAAGQGSFSQFLQMKVRLVDLVIFATLLGVWNLCFSAMSLYGSKRLASRRSEAFDVMKATTLCAFVLGVASVVLDFQWVRSSFVLAFWGCSTILIVSVRMVVRTWQRAARTHGRDSRNMLIVGSNQRAIDFAKSIQSRPELGYRIIGFADQEWAGMEEMQNCGWKRVCGLEELRDFLRRSVVDEVVLTIPLRSFHDLASSVASMCEQQGIILRVLSDLFNLKQSVPAVEEFDHATMVAHSGTLMDGWPLIIKRTLDFVVSLLLLIALAPALVLTAIAIRLTSAGPVFFRQKRIGLNKRIFNIYKFRTMVIDAEQKLAQIEHLNEVSGPVFKIKNDPRITPLGKFLRKTSIDELPQLFNVLRGDMSLVGPRPLQLRDYELFTDAGEDWQRRRFSVRPGITCLWQVNGRSSLPFHEWMELDLEYVTHWSLWLDLQILAKTIPAVLRGAGAA